MFTFSFGKLLRLGKFLKPCFQEYKSDAQMGFLTDRRESQSASEPRQILEVSMPITLFPLHYSDWHGCDLESENSGGTEVRSLCGR